MFKSIFKKTRQAIPAIAIVAFVVMILACRSSKYSIITEQQNNRTSKTERCLRIRFLTICHNESLR